MKTSTKFLIVLLGLVLLMDLGASENGDSHGEGQDGPPGGLGGAHGRPHLVKRSAQNNGQKGGMGGGPPGGMGGGPQGGMGGGPQGGMGGGPQGGMGGGPQGGVGASMGASMGTSAGGKR